MRCITRQTLDTNFVAKLIASLRPQKSSIQRLLISITDVKHAESIISREIIALFCKIDYSTCNQCTDMTI